jgi:competence protein ComEC
MAVVFLAGLALGRQQSGVAALGVAAVGMTAVNPGTATDIGFQLSLAATAGLIVFGPWLHYGLRRALRQAGGLGSGLLQIVAWTIAATVGTLPIIWLNFGEISLIGVFANIAVEPVFAVALGLSLVTALAGTVWEPAGWIAGLVTYYPLAFITWLTGELAAVPFASVSPARIGGSTAAAMYAAMVAAGIAALRYLPPELDRDVKPGTAQAMRRLALAGMTGGMGVVVWWWGVAPLGGPGELEVVVLDVGQGDAILVTTPAGEQVLVDGGRSGLVLVRELGEVLPHWDRRIDAIILSHPQEDHMAGLPEVLARFDVGAVYDDGAENRSEAFEAFERRARDVRSLAAGDVLTFDGVEFRVLWPPADRTGGQLNDRSLVIRVSYGETTVLLTGDIEGPAERALMEVGGLEADVLKVPHHGAATSVPPFFAAVDARVALISVGEGNAFEHPREETLRALSDTATYRTDKSGRITVRSDGRRLTVDTER